MGAAVYAGCMGIRPDQAMAASEELAGDGVRYRETPVSPRTGLGKALKRQLKPVFCRPKLNRR